MQISNLENELRITKVKEGIDFILSHFEGRQLLFPRKISTAFSNGRQFTVYNRDQIIQECIKSNFIDCRINAYPIIDQYNHQAPNIIFIDFDLSKDLPYKQAFIQSEKTKSKTLKIIKEKLNGCIPTVLWTGNGYHIYIVLEIRPLETIKELKELSPKPSEEFLRFSELIFSNKTKDSAHNPSFRSSLLRIPYTHNSKNMEEVKIRQEFDKDSISSINSELLRGFRLWLVDNDVKEKQQKLKRYNKSSSDSKDDTIKSYVWIEKLLQTPIPYSRRYCMYRIIIPYLVNVRRLSYNECFNISYKWLEKCNNISKICFDIYSEIKGRLKAIKRYKPISIQKLKNDNEELYNLIFLH